ncbi:peptide chain release factor N(5)-glutamine methyltransferase [Nakamurella endophytica]|uniref:Release factor glutamine methyltransferase n=1 Tax=Nakamurella endophytica TaxID=1748367 RepID=A0A917TCS5_9ACTN|nr:peptide chain release factor N(5)-glutamine methyltransferase [Nakamurella endophytica]GGM18072.1 release factor glutamine methyltransferase [Nakamurella endophytica]
MTTRSSLRVEILTATAALAAAGVGSPQVDAELLAAHLLGVPRTRLGLVPLVDDGWVTRYRELVAGRERRVPLQHLTGVAVLGPVEVEVGPGVFVPRPETESLVEWAVAAVRGVTTPVVVDLCTGSGAIALAVAAARPDARVHAVERSPHALSWARRNVERHRAAGGSPVDLRGGDIADPRLLVDLEGQVDLVTANPPYVPEGTAVEPEVGVHDPAEAVFAGPDGLDVIRPLLSVAAALLRPGGVLAVEHDDTQGESVPALLRSRRVLADVEDHRDLSGRPRFTTARRVRLRDR